MPCSLALVRLQVLDVWTRYNLWMKVREERHEKYFGLGYQVILPVFNLCFLLKTEVLHVFLNLCVVQFVK